MPQQAARKFGHGTVTAFSKVYSGTVGNIVNKATAVYEATVDAITGMCTTIYWIGVSRPTHHDIIGLHEHLWAFSHTNTRPLDIVVLLRERERSPSMLSTFACRFYSWTDRPCCPACLCDFRLPRPLDWTTAPGTRARP